MGLAGEVKLFEGKAKERKENDFCLGGIIIFPLCSELHHFESSLYIHTYKNISIFVHTCCSLLAHAGFHSYWDI